MGSTAEARVPNAFGLAMVFPCVSTPAALGLSLQDTNQVVPEFPGLSPVERFGVLDGDTTLVFGRLSGLAVDAERGIVFVVDELAHKLSAVTKEGEFLAWAGGKGRGSRRTDRSEGGGGQRTGGSCA